ncbi:MAG: hypothetical protein ACKPBU_13005, partial [Alphaproteobacteria bacterium]
MRPALLALAGLLAAHVLAASPARAHLVAPQHGTLNLVDASAFLVLSLPISAFDGIDADGSGGLDEFEIARAAAAIEERVHAAVSLRDASGPRPLEGILLAPSPASDEPGAPLRQVIVLGRFALDPARSAGPLRLAVRLRGASADEQAFEVSARRGPARTTLRFDASHEEQEIA